MESDSTLKQAFSLIDEDQEYASRKLAMFTLVGLSAVFFISVVFTPPAREYFSVCGFKNFTGLPCPGCGLTHSFCAVGKGDFFSAFSYNLVGPPLFLVLVMVWLRAASVLLGRMEPVRIFDQFAERIRIVRLFAIAFVIYGVGRITYLLLFDSAPFKESALSRLVAGLFH